MLLKTKQRTQKWDKMSNMGIIQSVQRGSLHKALSKKLIIGKTFWGQRSRKHFSVTVISPKHVKIDFELNAAQSIYRIVDYTCAVGFENLPGIF